MTLLGAAAISSHRTTEMTILRSLVAALSGKADEERRPQERAVRALRAGGFPSHFVPAPYGGGKSSFVDLLSDVQSVAQGCASAAWCATIYAVASRMAGYLPAEGQRQIWGKGADVLISASFRPSGSASAGGTGWTLSGHWHYLSGITYADWALVCFAPNGEGARYAAIPVSELHIVDDWSTLGMRGTGSHSVQLNEVFVPQHRTFLKQDLWGGKARAVAGPCYQVSPVDGDPPLFAGVALGAARAAIDLWTSRWRDFRPDSEMGIAYARSLAELDAASLLLERACRASDTGLLSVIDTGRNGRDSSLAIEYILTAIGRIFRLSGSQAHFDQSPALRHWRDVQTLASHVALRQDLNFSQYTKGLWQSQESVDPRAA